MDNQQLRRLGETLFGWEFWEDVDGANLPHPLSVLTEALEGKRRPIFWLCFNPAGKFFNVAEPGQQAIHWNPLGDSRQRERIVTAVESLGGSVSVLEGGISASRADGSSCVYADSSPERICEAALWAVSTDAEQLDD